MVANDHHHHITSAVSYVLLARVARYSTVICLVLIIYLHLLNLLKWYKKAKRGHFD